ncbi:MAG: acetyl-CoA carboxylase biotin carboxylase subunit [Candidatus Bathyarchaeota archaeon]|nr:MAG: acetyl-CoA carboxylase biotin carboxylase subunit [Candidatus Bathyarchaeota archaeon]
MFDKILIANRGEIAIRVIRACKELGIKSVAVYSEADRQSLHVRYADEHYCIGPAKPAESYLDINKIVEAAKKSGSEAIHPGYGFLAETPAFAAECESNRIEFIGPPSKAMRKMGSKITARKNMANADIPVIPGSMHALKDEGEVAEVAETIGYPILIKAVYGGGGKGMRIINNDAEIEKAMELAQSEAQSSFGSSEVYVEKLLTSPRHIELQILADRKGNIINLGERECSIQRRYQKLIEETPSPMMTKKLREAVAEKAMEGVSAINYENAGTMEFLIDAEANFHFLEMNTRLQVEHIITELVTGVDIVKEQMRIASGEGLSYRQDDISMKGHALNCRINSEDPYSDFVPCPGTVTEYHPPGGPGVRVDSALYAGYTIPIFYDSLVAKLAVWGTNRDETISRMKNALNEYVVEGIRTTMPLHKAILNDERFRRGKIHTNFIQERMSSLMAEDEFEGEKIAALSAVLAAYLSDRQEGLALVPQRSAKGVSAWKMAARRALMNP